MCRCVNATKEIEKEWKNWENVERITIKRSLEIKRTTTREIEISWAKYKLIKWWKINKIDSSFSSAKIYKKLYMVY